MGKTVRGGAVQRRASSWGLSAIAMLAAWLTGACTTLPDVKPFAAATLSLEQSVGESFDATVRSVKNVGSLLVVDSSHAMAGAIADRAKVYSDLAASMATDGEQRKLMLRALTDYADALAAIVDAASGASGNVDALADSVQNLASAFGASPLPAAAGPAVDLVKLAAREAIQIKASSDLRKGLERGNVVVQKAGEILTEDVRALKKSLATKEGALDAALALTADPRLAVHASLEAQRAGLLTKLAAKQGAPVTGDPDWASLLQVEQQLAAAEAWYRPLVQPQEDMKADLHRSIALLAAVEASLQQWIQAHAELVQAARDERPVNVRRLVEIVNEVNEIRNRMKEANDA